MSNQLVKIVFRLNSGDWHRSASESVWAAPVSTDGATPLYRIENSPFHSKEASYHDTVNATSEEGNLYFSRVVLKGGHSTYRLLLDDLSDLFESWWSKLSEMGCSYENGEENGKILLSVDVPPAADIFAVYKALEGGEAIGIWQFEEGHVGHDVNK